MKKITTKAMSAVLSAAMLATMSVSVMAAPLNTGLTAGDLATVDAEAGTLNGSEYNIYEVNGATVEDGQAVPSGAANSVVVLNVEPTNFKVRMPIALHVAQDAEGVKTYADSMVTGATGEAKIENLCNLGQVAITDVDIVTPAGWSLSAFDADYANMKVNTKTYGFKINGLAVNAETGVVLDNNTATDTITSELKADATGVTYDDYTFTPTGTSEFPIIASGSVLPISYEAKLPAMSSAIENTVIGGVVFTVDFNSAT